MSETCAPSEAEAKAEQLFGQYRWASWYTNTCKTSRRKPSAFPRGGALSLAFSSGRWRRPGDCLCLLPCRFQ